MGKYWRVLFFFGVILMIACNSKKHLPRHVERGFYYWQSIYNPTVFEKEQLSVLKINGLYIKYFDVDWNTEIKSPLPVAIIRFKEKPDYRMIPTVFITNECIRQTDTAQITSLSEKIVTLIRSINADNNIDSIKEVQIDCDWSKQTREKYFKLLMAIRQEWIKVAGQSDLTLSATIRLYQVKYANEAGVPPVDKGLLMCYNMGNLKNPVAGNSIIDINEFKKYTGNLGTYSLPLDVALPIFNWKVWFRDGTYHGITEAFPDSLLVSPVFAKDNDRFTVKNDTLLAGFELKKNDMLRFETSDINTVYAVADEVSKQLKNTSCRVSLYHLDEVILKKYQTHELESIFDRLR